MLIANSNLVPQWATWEHFRELDAAGLMMYGQMTAGSWIYIGTQGILQGTYETFAAVARKRFGGTLAGRLVVTAGLGGMGGAQPLAVTMNERLPRCASRSTCTASSAACRRATSTSAPPTSTTRSSASRRRASRAAALSVGLLGNAAEVLPELVRRGVEVDVVTDQTSAHDPLNGYVPAGLTVEQAEVLRRSDPDDYLRRVGESRAHARGRHPRPAARGRRGVRLRQRAARPRAESYGDEDAFAYPGFVPAYIRPLFCEGKGPFRWVALSGDPADIHATDEAILDLFGDQEHIARWIALAQERVRSRASRRGSAGWATASATSPACASTRWSPAARCKAPIVIGRDHLDAGSVASPERETESMADGTDAVADWPLLNALVNTACGARGCRSTTAAASGWASRSTPARSASPTGRRRAAERIRRVLTADPGMGIVRHADSGEPEALAAAARTGVRMPMLDPDPA